LGGITGNRKSWKLKTESRNAAKKPDRRKA